MEGSQDYQFAQEELEGRRLRLNVEVSEERVQQEMHRAARRIARETKIPGFRKGKAPYEVIVQRFGERALRAEVVDNLIQTIFGEVMDATEVVPYARPSLESIEIEPLQFSVVLPLPPRVDLGDYRSLRLEPPTVEVDEKEIEQALEELCQQNAVLEPAQGRGAQPGDVLVISVEGYDGDGNEVLNEDEIEVVLDLEAENPAPGFYQQLVGIKPGEERAFELALPADPPENVEFSVELVNLFDRILPGIDDDLARTVGDYESLEALKQQIAEGIRVRKEHLAKDEYTDQIVKALVEQAQIEYPREMLENELDEAIKRFEERVKREMHVSLVDYLTLSNRSEEELRNEMEPEVRERLERTLALGEFVAAEALRVDEEVIDAQIAEFSEMMGSAAERAREYWATEKGRETVENRLLMTKMFERLRAIARGEADDESDESVGEVDAGEPEMVRVEVE